MTEYNPVRNSEMARLKNSERIYKYKIKTLEDEIARLVTHIDELETTLKECQAELSEKESELEILDAEEIG